MFQIKAKVVYNKRVNKDCYELSLLAKPIARCSWPGQFVNLRVSEIEPLLRRPFSIYRIDQDTIVLIYEIKGPATVIMEQIKRGAFLDVIGPLGNGFTLKGKSGVFMPLLIAGGMGVAPLVFLAEKLTQAGNDKCRRPCREKPEQGICSPTVLLGAKNRKQLLCGKEFKRLGFDVKISTDDGSLGFKGKVTDLLKRLLSASEYRRSAIYACGPRPMLKEITRISKKHNIPAQVSLEEHMACGFGACLGCAVKTIDGYQRVCKEGPVFKADKLIY